VNVDGSGFACVGPKGNVWDAVWSPDGQWIAFTMAGKSASRLFELFLMHPDGSGKHALVSAADGRFSLHPAWSSDSKQILIVRGMDMESTDLWAVNVDGSQLHQVTRVPAGYGGIAWLS
jgi:Tol biopolymer transport system component